MQSLGKITVTKRALTVNIWHHRILSAVPRRGC